MNVTYIVIVLLVVFASMVLHEVMHGLVALYLGDDTAKHQGRLTLNPLKHIDPFLTILLPLILAISGLPIFGGAKPVPFNPNRLRGGEWGVALVALAGPLTNLVLAFIFYGIFALTGTHSDTLLGQVLSIIVAVNLGFFCFNILPILPLDGSRVLYALVPDFFRRFMETVERFGVMLVFLIVLVASPYIGVMIVTMENFIVAVFARIFGLA